MHGFAQHHTVVMEVFQTECLPVKIEFGDDLLCDSAAIKARRPMLGNQAQRFCEILLYQSLTGGIGD